MALWQPAHLGMRIFEVISGAVAHSGTAIDGVGRGAAVRGRPASALTAPSIFTAGGARRCPDYHPHRNRCPRCPRRAPGLRRCRRLGSAGGAPVPPVPVEGGGGGNPPALRQGTRPVPRGIPGKPVNPTDSSRNPPHPTRFSVIAGIGRSPLETAEVRGRVQGGFRSVADVPDQILGEGAPAELRAGSHRGDNPPHAADEVVAGHQRIRQGRGRSSSLRPRWTSAARGRGI